MSKRMLYKYPGPHEIHGDNFDYIIVEDTEEAVAEAINEGWALTTTEAKEGSKPITPAPKKAGTKSAW